MILVTGAAGFIGSNIVAALNEAGRTDIVFCDRLRSDQKWRNLAKAGFVDFVPPEELAGWLRRTGAISQVIHMGAISATTAIDGDLVMDSNFRFSLALLEHCTAAAIPFLYASSAAVYGDGSRGFDDDADPAAILRLRPLNLYGWSKRQFDFVVADRLARAAPLPPCCIGLRFFNVFGPNEYHKGDMRSIVTKIAESIGRDETVRLFKSHKPGISDGDQRRDFIYVKDAVEMSLALLATGATGIFNIGTGKARTFRELADAVFAAHRRPSDIAYVDMPEDIRARYQYLTEASLGRVRAAGYARSLDVAAGIGDYVDNYLIPDDPYR